MQALGSEYLQSCFFINSQMKKEGKQNSKFINNNFEVPNNHKFIQTAFIIVAKYINHLGGIRWHSLTTKYKY